MSSTIHEPQRRRDNTCVVCRGSMPDRVNGTREPFCSTACCRAWYDTQLPETRFTPPAERLATAARSVKARIARDRRRRDRERSAV